MGEPRGELEAKSVGKADCECVGVVAEVREGVAVGRAGEAEALLLAPPVREASSEVEAALLALETSEAELRCETVALLEAEGLPLAVVSTVRVGAERDGSPVGLLETVGVKALLAEEEGGIDWPPLADSDPGLETDGGAVAVLNAVKVGAETDASPVELTVAVSVKVLLAEGEGGADWALLTDAEPALEADGGAVEVVKAVMVGAGTVGLMETVCEPRGDAVAVLTGLPVAVLDVGTHSPGACAARPCAQMAAVYMRVQ